MLECVVCGSARPPFLSGTEPRFFGRPSLGIVTVLSDLTYLLLFERSQDNLAAQLLLASLALQSLTFGNQLAGHSRDLKHQTQYSQVLNQQTQFLRLPCSCGGSNCGCCATLSVPPLQFNQQGCVQLTYVPADLGVDLDVFLNGNNLYHTSLSARNPPPFCVGTGVPLLNLCVRLYNIRIQNYNVHVCINLELQFASRPLIVVSFDCVRVGIDGVGIEKPASRVLSPDPVGHKHTRKSINLTPQILSAAYITMDSNFSE